MFTKYQFALLFFAALVAGALLAACGGKSASAKPRFDPGSAAVLSKASLIEARDLPGGGWQLTEEKSGDTDDEDDDAADEFIQNEPACAEYSKFLQLIEGGPYDEEPLGEAMREFTRERPTSLIPTTVQVQVEIYATPEEVAGAFTFVRDAMGPQIHQCLALFFANAITEEMAGSGITASARPIGQALAAPRDGMTLAFEFSVPITAGLSLDGVFHMFSWPYSNAAVTVLVIGSHQEVSPELLSGALSAIDAKLVSAAGDAR